MCMSLSTASPLNVCSPNIPIDPYCRRECTVNGSVPTIVLYLPYILLSIAFSLVMVEKTFMAVFSANRKVCIIGPLNPLFHRYGDRVAFVIAFSVLCSPSVCSLLHFF